MSQLEAVIVATFIGSGVVALVLVLSVLLLPLAPTRIQKSVKAGITRWNEESIRVVDRGLYAVAVVLIISTAIGLVASVLYLFVR